MNILDEKIVVFVFLINMKFMCFVHMKGNPVICNGENFANMAYEEGIF